jgi:molybdopterin-dependent oxidoreductase alpha subunit
MLSTLEAAKVNGARLVHVNPLPETGMQRFKHPQEVKGWLSKGTKMADHFAQVRINGDVALLTGLAKWLIEMDDGSQESVLDHRFITERTDGFEEFREAVQSADWETICRESGITREQIEEIAGLMAGTSRIIFCWAMGLTQHENAVANVQMIVNILLMKGAIGRPGAGACPVRGHSNVQGDRTVGITPRPKTAFLDALAERYGFQPPREPGLDTVDAIRGMHAGAIKVFFALGGNFLSATPDTDYTAEALRQCDLTVQVSTKLNRAHVVTGRTALILPCLGRTERDDQALGEQFVSVENSMGIVHASCGHLEPASDDLLSEPAIVAGVADAVVGSKFDVRWLELIEDYDRIREEIEAVIPGFENYVGRVRDPNGFYLPNPAREGRFETPVGRALFTVHPIPESTLAEDEFMMMTIRSHDQYNTTIYGLDDRYRGIHGGRRVVFVNEDDAAERGLSAGDKVDLVGEYNGKTRRADGFTVVPFAIPSKCVATYFPEANVLVPVDKVAAKSNTPASKSVVVRLVRGPGSGVRRRDGA